MNKITEDIFRNRMPDFEKLKRYGFVQSDNNYICKTSILDGQFELKITVGKNGVETEVTDAETNEPYTLFLADGASGSFIGAVKTAYTNALLCLAENCFHKNVFKSEYARKLILYAEDKYGSALEFLWEKFTDNAIWRRKDNKKWYGILLTVPKNKLGLPSDDKVEIIDLRTNPESIDSVIDNKTVFGGYHMNKKHWITVCLDGTVPLKKIENMLDISYELAGRK